MEFQKDAALSSGRRRGKGKELRFCACHSLSAWTESATKNCRQALQVIYKLLTTLTCDKPYMWQTNIIDSPFWANRISSSGCQSAYTQTTEGSQLV